MEPDDGTEDEGPSTPLLPPDDRLWRHPSEISPGARSGQGPGEPWGFSGTGDALKGGWSGLQPQGSRAMDNGGVRRIWAIAVVAGVVGALTASGIGIVTGAFEQQTTVVRAIAPQGPALTLASDTGSAANWTTIDDTLAPSVVGIDVSGPSGPSSGSGLLFVEGTNDSYIITVSSLVSGGGAIKLSFLSGETVYAHVVGNDPTSGLALLSARTKEGVFPNLGSVADLQVANPVLVIGARSSPGASVYAGSVTAEDKEVDTADGAAMQNMISATTSAVPDAAAGGPMVDSQGRVVGITLSVDPTNASDQGLTFAVPIDVAERVAEQILTSGTASHPWLGVTDAFDVPSAVAHQFGLSGGAQVGAVWPGSPASRIGLSQNDIITSLAGVPITSTGSLTRVLSQCSPGKALPISYVHDGLAHQTTVIVSNQPPGN